MERCTVLATPPRWATRELPHRAVALAVSHSGHGYWVFDANGCTEAFGDAGPMPESICTTPLNAPILDAAATPSGKGYWLVANDGGMFAFGDAAFHGSMGGKRLNRPVVGMVAAPSGNGYWEVASDGGIFAFAEPFLGSMGATPLDRPVVGMVSSGGGYLMVASDGGIFNFGNPFFGSLGASPPPSPIVAAAPSVGGGRPNGYWMLDGVGNVYAFGSSWLPASVQSPPPPPTAGGTPAAACGLPDAAFCDTLATPSGIGNRSGQLNGTVWGVSRISGNESLGSQMDAWAVTESLDECGRDVTVRPDNDIAVCGGAAVETTNDGGTVTTLAMYPKQPFDVAGRTGTVVFDVSNDSQGSHAAWPEFWMTNLPVPAPFVHEDQTGGSVPHDGFGIRFARVCAAGQGSNCGPGPGCQNNQTPVFGVDSAVVVRNYANFDTFIGTGRGVTVTPLDCAKEATGPGHMNHIELKISQNQIDVYGTDAGTTSPLRHLAVVSNVDLTLTRGLIWIEDAHYNGDKFNSQRTHTFAWANVGFDGPVLPRDLTFDVLDNNTPSASLQDGDPGINLGWSVPTGGSPLSLQVPSVRNVSDAAKGLLTYNFYTQSNAGDNVTLSYSLNGHPFHSIPWPFPDDNKFGTRTFGEPIDLSEVVDGTNTIRFTSTVGMTIMNIDLILVGAGGTVSPT